MDDVLSLCSGNDLRLLARSGTKWRGADTEPRRGGPDSATPAELRDVRRGEPNPSDREATIDRANRVLSLCSGIGGLDHGLANAGWTHVGFCESDSYRRDVLRARFPGVPVWDDLRSLGLDTAGPGRGEQPRESGLAESTGVEWRQLGPQTVHLVCGGTPCQDLSVAGRRAGLNGDRSNLFFDFARVVDVVRPRWVLWENVPGAFSSNGGRDFGVVLGTLADIGYGLAWRVLDSRYFGVPQRRRRVFVVGAFADGDPRAAAIRAGEVLAVGSRCPRHPATRGEAREDIAGTLGGGSGERGWAQDTERMTFVPQIAPVLTKNYGKQPDNSDTDAGPMLIAETVRSHPRPGSNSNGNLVAALHLTQDPIHHHHHHHALGHEGAGVVQGASVRRLTPQEAERLQALPDGWTDLGGTPDSKRYAALGDAVTASVAEWIGGRMLAAGACGGERTT